MQGEWWGDAKKHSLRLLSSGQGGLGCPCMLHVQPLPSLLWATQRHCSDEAFSPALSESKWHPASVEMKDFSCCGLEFSQYTLQLLLCLTYLFFAHLSYLTQSDQQLQEGLAVCLLPGAASLPPQFYIWFQSDVLCPLPIFCITFLLFLLV